jgi:hypothetical protein
MWLKDLRLLDVDMETSAANEVMGSDEELGRDTRLGVFPSGLFGSFATFVDIGPNLWPAYGQIKYTWYELKGKLKGQAFS